MTLVPVEEADGIVDRFLTLLKELNIEPLQGSQLEDELLSLTKLKEGLKNPSSLSEKDRAALWRSAAGLHDFAAKVLSVEHIAEFAELHSHLRLIMDGKSLSASLGQNAKSGYDDDVARKMAELYIGCLVAHVGTEVSLDSPSGSRGDNPDVMFRLEPEGPSMEAKNWGLAIKTISSHHGQTIFERIKEGANQIERCSADVGMVVINAKDALDHDALWDENFTDLHSATEALTKQLHDLANSADKDRSIAEWDDIFSLKTVRPVLFLGQSTVRLPTSAVEETPTALKVLVAYGVDGVCDPVAKALAEHLNHLMQTILHGIPGGDDFPPG